MTVPHRRARPMVAALGLAVCLVSGCAVAPRVGPTVAPSQTQTGESTAVLTLSDAQERRAEALAHYATGLTLEITTGMASALEQYEQSLELDPSNVGLALRLGDYYLGKKESVKAVAVMERAIKANPDSAELRYGLAVAYKIGDQPDKALDTVRQTLKIQPSNLRAIQMLLECEITKPSPTGTLNALDVAWKQSSADPYYWTRLGDLYALVLKQKPSAANQTTRLRIQESYEKALKISPKEIEILMRLGDVYADANNFARAAEIYAQVILLQPDIQQIREKLAFCYVRAGQPDKATGIFEEMIKRDPLRFEVYNALADMYEELKNDEKALSNFQQSLVINPNQISPYLRISLLQSKAKEYDEALKTLANAEQKFPNSFQVAYFRGLVNSDKKDYAQAVVAFTEAEKIARETPDDIKLDSQFYFYFGAAYERSGAIDQAVTMFRKSIEIDPDKAGAYNYLGYMWADKGVHLDEAHELIKKALVIEPDNGAYLDSIGWVLFKLGRTEEALTPLRQAAEKTQEGDAVIFDHLADVLIKLGKRDEALIQLRRGLQVDPTNKEITEKIQKLTNEQSAAPPSK